MSQNVKTLPLRAAVALGIWASAGLGLVALALGLKTTEVFGRGSVRRGEKIAQDLQAIRIDKRTEILSRVVQNLKKMRKRFVV